MGSGLLLVVAAAVTAVEIAAAVAVGEGIAAVVEHVVVEHVVVARVVVAGNFVAVVDRLL